MKEQKILKTLSELIADVYPEVVFCPLDDERDLLLGAGTKSKEDFFEACHNIFGLNADRAYLKAIICVSDYCEILHATFNDYENRNELWDHIQYADELVSAVEYLSKYAPIASIGDQALWYGQTSFFRLGLNAPKSKFKAQKSK